MTESIDKGPTAILYRRVRSRPVRLRLALSLLGVSVLFTGSLCILLHSRVHSIVRNADHCPACAYCLAAGTDMEIVPEPKPDFQLLAVGVRRPIDAAVPSKPAARLHRSRAPPIAHS